MEQLNLSRKDRNRLDKLTEELERLNDNLEELNSSEN